MNIIEEASRIDGWMAPDELGWLSQTAATRRRIVEVGSWKGRSTKALAMATPGQVFAIDHWRGSETERSTWQKEAVDLGADAMFDEFCRNLGPEIVAGKLVPLRQDCELVAKTLGVLLRSDFVFIDGAHTYAEVKRDIERWRAVCAPKAILSGHDFSHEGVARAVHDVLGDVAHAPGSIWYVTMT